MGEDLCWAQGPEEKDSPPGPEQAQGNGREGGSVCHRVLDRRKGACARLPRTSWSSLAHRAAPCRGRQEMRCVTYAPHRLQERPVQRWAVARSCSLPFRVKGRGQQGAVCCDRHLTREWKTDGSRLETAHQASREPGLGWIVEPGRLRASPPRVPCHPAQCRAQSPRL